MGVEKTTGSVNRSASARPLSDRFASGNKREAGVVGVVGEGEGKSSSITNRQKVVYDESKDVEEEALLFSPQLLLSCRATSERCVWGVLPFSGCGWVVSGWCCD